MTEDDIQRIVRKEVLKLLRPLALAIKQANGMTTQAIDTMFELGKKK